jgi:hypothetical protein
MNKKFDCVEMKNQLQEKLYNKIEPKNIKDYFDKLNKYKKEDNFYKELKKQRKKELING